MMSFPEHTEDDLFTLHEKDEAVADFVALVGHQLQEAFLNRKASDKITMQSIAEALDLDRSRIHRCLSGSSNLTLASVAELIWALRGKPRFEIDLDEDDGHGRNFVKPAIKSLQPAAQTQVGGRIFRQSEQNWSNAPESAK
ncbi:hypothetical protein RFM68_17545 [Mesorhizobium sp. MSK_1335]|uniref:HTH cro/C1-type domain-containing protein n=1 Tax=Mesorhizobium montanum TaxID=3072323 RepID=A0ABU4ZLQ1_9HYPH|nr:hypothetical protein [Mesorhizobium sp. MSK_1335]MDX8526307.1 hypothetical protein [Mesorhizobium sp. MSK_1335]